MKIPKPYCSPKIIRMIPNYWYRRIYNSISFSATIGLGNKGYTELIKCLTDYKNQNGEDYKWDILEINKYENKKTN